MQDGQSPKPVGLALLCNPRQASFIDLRDRMQGVSNLVLRISIPATQSEKQVFMFITVCHLKDGGGDKVKGLTVENLSPEFGTLNPQAWKTRNNYCHYVFRVQDG